MVTQKYSTKTRKLGAVRVEIGDRPKRGTLLFLVKGQSVNMLQRSTDEVTPNLDVQFRPEKRCNRVE